LRSSGGKQGSPILKQAAMAFRNAYDARVLSILDFDYSIPIHSSYHPCFKNAAKKRLQKSYPEFNRALTQAFMNRAASNVWGILIEQDGQPMVVVQNLGCRVRNNAFRRLLRVNMNASYP
jgi:hypothetical protein